MSWAKADGSPPCLGIFEMKWSCVWDLKCQWTRLSVTEAHGLPVRWGWLVERAGRVCVCVGGEGSSSTSSFSPSVFSCVSDGCCVLSCPLQIVPSEGALDTRDMKLTRSFLGMASSLARGRAPAAWHWGGDAGYCFCSTWWLCLLAPLCLWEQRQVWAKWVTQKKKRHPFVIGS